MSRKRRKKILKAGGDFLKISLGIALVALLAFYLKGKTFQFGAKPKAPEKIIKTETKKAESTLAEKRIQKSKALSELLPSQAWQDDYLVLKAPLGKSDSELYLVALGLAPEGKSPEKIQEASKLKPSLLVVKKEGNDFIQITHFDFETQETSLGGLQSKNLKGIPRIKSSDLIDLDENGMPEIRVSFDTSTDLAEAIGFLRWNGSELSWLKAKDNRGNEKIALWLSGASSSDSHQIDVKKTPKGYEIIQKYGQANPKHPEQGFVWQSTVWRMREGVLQSP